MRAWRDLQTTDDHLFGMQFGSMSARMRQHAYLYSIVDLSDVDPILQQHFLKFIATYTSAARLSAEMEAHVAGARQNSEAAAEFGAFLGAAAGDGTNPQRDAVAGAIVFGLISAAAQENDSLDVTAQYNERWGEMMRRVTALSDANVRVAAELTCKYGTPSIAAM